MVSYDKFFSTYQWDIGSFRENCNIAFVWLRIRNGIVCSIDREHAHDRPSIGSCTVVLEVSDPIDSAKIMIELITEVCSLHSIHPSVRPSFLYSLYSLC